MFEPSVIHVDESIRTLQVSVLRNDGLFGFVTVDYETQDVTAKSLPGNTSMFGIENVHNVSKFKCSHSFNVIRDTYLIVISEDHSTLYWWRGVFLKVKVSALDIQPLTNLLQILCFFHYIIGFHPHVRHIFNTRRNLNINASNESE